MDSLRDGTLSAAKESVVKESSVNESDGKADADSSRERGETRVLRRRCALASNEQDTNATNAKNNMIVLNFNCLSKVSLGHKDP